MLRALIAAALFSLPTGAWAAPACDIPDDPPIPHLEEPTADQPSRLMPIGGYTLALIWQPQHCRTATRGAESMICEHGKIAHGFVLHGLWPDGYDKSWPQYCRPTTILPPAVIKHAWCATPSAQLLQHEWEKHGTCVAAKPETFFAMSNTLFYKLKFPNLNAKAEWRAGDLASAVAASNPGLKANAIRITAHDGWLEELWLCLDARRKYVRCKPGSGGVPMDAMMKVAKPRIIAPDVIMPN